MRLLERTNTSKTSFQSINETSHHRHLSIEAAVKQARYSLGSLGFLMKARWFVFRLYLHILMSSFTSCFNTTALSPRIFYLFFSRRDSILLEQHQHRNLSQFKKTTIRSRKADRSITGNILSRYSCLLTFFTSTTEHSTKVSLMDLFRIEYSLGD